MIKGGEVNMAAGKVLVIMGSDSDFPVMEGCFKMLNKFGVGFKATVASAHRTPDKAMALARGAEAEGRADLNPEAE